MDRHGRTRLHRHIGRYALLIGAVLLLAWPTSLVSAGSPVTFTYTSAVNAPVGIAPDATTVADLNGDGKADLVVANSRNNTVSVLLGKGDGTFTSAPGSPITVGAKPVALALADLNGDGKKDLVVANQDGNSVSVLLGNGSGTFTQATGSPITVGTFPTAVAVGDLNGDGHLDLVVANQTDSTLSVLLGNGSGAFTAALGSPISIDNRPNVVAIGDLNGDGHLDIVVGTDHARGRVYSLLGKGDGAFFAPVAAPPFSFSPFTSVVIAEIDGDTKPDTLVSGTEGNVVDVLHGVGDGTFTYTPATDRLFVGNNPTGVAVADLNGDGKPDFLVANTNDNTISVFFGNGSGEFTRAFPAPPIPGVSALFAIADFNGDGKLDLAVPYGSGQLRILLGDGHGGFTPLASPITINNNDTIAVTGDFNGDGKADLALLSPYLNGSIDVLLGNGDGTFNAPITTPSSSGTYWSALAAGDLNGDGKADLAVGDINHNTVTPLIGAGNGAFTVGVPITVGTTPADVEIADLNGDHKADIVVTNYGDNTVTVLLSNGGSPVTFTQAPGSPIPVGMAPYQVVIADLNGDGKKDLAVANRNDSTVSVLLGVGNGTFTAAPGSPIANRDGNNGTLAVGDVNGDGIPDLTIPDANGDGFIDVLTGNGNGSFTANGYALGGSPGMVAGDITLADVNGDGKRDIITMGSNISLLLNTTVFAPPTPKPAPSPRPGPPPSGGPPHPAPPSRPGPPPSGGPPRPIPIPRR